MLGVLGIFKARGTQVFNKTISESSRVAGGSLTSTTAIKCLLHSQAYAPFLLNMALPFIFAALIAMIMVPTTSIKRRIAKSKRESEDRARQRRERATRAALGIDEYDEGEEVAEINLPPRFEPIVDLGGMCDKLPTKIATKLPCCRKAATEEYITNAQRKFEGLPRLPPRYRAWLDIDQRAGAGIPEATLLAFPCCRVETTEEERKAWRAATAVRDQRMQFKPLRRFNAVMVLTMYGLFPTLVASAASIFNCTDEVEGKRYLFADLSQTCYEGLHIFYLVLSVIAIIVYCLGTPITLATILMFDVCIWKTPTRKVDDGDDANVVDEERQEGEEEEEEEGSGLCVKFHKVCGTCHCICMKRSSTPWGFRTSSFRERFGLLISGYATDRGSLIIAWEPLVVMLRKLFITLAGSIVQDPYLQITSALTILVASLTLQGALR